MPFQRRPRGEEFRSRKKSQKVAPPPIFVSLSTWLKLLREVQPSKARKAQRGSDQAAISGKRTLRASATTLAPGIAASKKKSRALGPTCISQGAARQVLPASSPQRRCNSNGRLDNHNHNCTNSSMNNDHNNTNCNLFSPTISKEPNRILALRPSPPPRFPRPPPPPGPAR